MTFRSFLTAMLLILVGGSSTVSAERPDGITYDMTVERSDGVVFNSCFVFGNDGVLTLIPGGLSLTFEQKDLGNSTVFWQAVTIGDVLPFNLGFSGMATGNEYDGMIKGDGISDFGTTFRFNGYPADCASFLSVQSVDANAVSPWVEPN